MSPSIPTHVVVVASWFPAVDETSRGRFVADQVQALAAGGRVRPAVISFDSIGLTGSPEARFDEAAAIASLTSAAIRRDGRLFSRSAASGPAGLPVARVAIAGSGSGIPSTYPVTQRERVLETLDDAVRGAEIVHAHTGFPDGAASAGFAERLGVPLVITEHASFIATILSDPDRRAAYLRGMTAARRVVAVSGMLGRELTEMIPAVADKVMVIPNAVDVEAFTPQPLTARHPDELVYVGYRIESKGMPLLLRTFAAVRRRRPSATLRLIGGSKDADEERRWHDLARSLGVSDAVSFEPSALRPAVADALGHASVLVHASPRETFGVTAVEALASGTPVVALDSGGVTETVGTDGRLGEIVHEPDPEAMAAAVVRTLERRPTFDAAVLRASAVDRYGASSVATRIADLYDELRPAAGPPVRAGIAFRADPAGSPVAPDRSVLVVGFLTHRTERILRTLPPATLARIDLLCGSGDDVATLPAGLAKVTAVDIDGPFRAALGPDGDRPRAASKRARIGRLVRDPIGIVRRRRVRSQRERYRLAAAEAALEVVVEARGAALESADVVGVTGLDYQAIARVPAAAARIVPGGLRWLADQHSGEIA